MQFPQSLGRSQLPLFHEAILANPVAPLLTDVVEETSKEEPDAFSELSLRGAAGHCRSLLASILRELSEEKDARWLTLIGAPAGLSRDWLRESGLNRERILILQPRGEQSALELACEALRLGRSHTVVSWLQLGQRAKRQLAQAARQGDAQSLNVLLG
ncbi:SOS-induced cell division inhibitor SulA [Pseudomonas sp. JS3066]|jgi:cell division inhibitor SulA|uniref:SOS-induced cell division inhibitor SulA n=1 Tax=unclassified Pseudomonas TaxID=196821 RepID=UPI000EAA5C16|nr:MULTISPECIES: SOS-induced cell division inhibitor SulA [unclassified Pseudomonas]AYF87329.1 CDP-glycerol--UDP-pyrophosphoryl-N-acetylglucosaminyl-N-acetylmannosamine glycerophosphotransferase [Pseudomonas sp. DY-1]MDH4652927.1 CDP-glycerol--UDP-pyrophosphoryl-N-acetylglucosaminyl-N-acetylmannosamine glycerophosphotransferase [Pseudomonas sp. BN606]MRK23158.1 CDP-glycerol--UDP-pyrophosphoryl-N-acetylglucosaminyl-N-acetylmannosamine glycerophosphotransferase [Pseudomonas sp. JG-B]WVK95129.1 SO